MPRMITVLEDCVRYRDGKKWKRRHCFLSKPDSKKGTVRMFITKQFGISVSNQEIEEKSLRQYLIDEITGFEHGRHVDKESHVMALIGCNVVYCIAFEQTETMFRWAETLSKLLTSSNFHVTLKKVSETNGLFNKIPVGTQGNLHVQHNRLCLIGEPADGNKFICEWSIGNLVSIDVHNTACDKVKRLQLKSNGKSHKGKGHFEFEVSLTQTSVFEESLRAFLVECKIANDDFKTNFVSKFDSVDGSTDSTTYSYSIIYNEKTGSNSENSSSFEKRSSEIPIPRSREHSGPDQRPIENAQVKMRKSQKNLNKAKKDIVKPFSTINIVCTNDDDICLFPDDEEIEDQVQRRSDHLLCRGLSQESSGVCVSGPSDSIKDVDLSIHVSPVHDDSGCDNSSGPALPSTSSGHHHHRHQHNYHHHDNHNALPQYHRTKLSPQPSVSLAFYRDVCQNPLSLTNYDTYFRLLKTFYNADSQLIRRSNSFNCIHVPELKKTEFSRKYSNINFPLNLSTKTSEQHFKQWKQKINRESIEDAFLSMNLDRDRADPAMLSLSHRLPFLSMNEFNESVIRSLQSGSVCFSLFSYHHFLSLVYDVKTVVRNIEVNKLVPSEAAVEYKNLKDLISRKNKVYNHWLERIQCYNSSCDDTEPSIIDINILLVFQIMDSILLTRSEVRHGYNETFPRYKCPTQLDPYTVCESLASGMSTNTSIYLDSRPVLTTSSSTPDFRDSSGYRGSRVHKLSAVEPRPNLSSFDTFDTTNDAFSRHNCYLNKPGVTDSKEGSFKRFRRKCSPNVLIPFIRRKTSSIHSTVSEPICHHDTKEQNSYYNLANHRDLITKKSLSVVLDNYPYINVKQDYNSSKIFTNSGTTRSSDYSDYANIDPSLCDDNTCYPDEILDPSRNYGDLNFIKGRIRYSSRHDSEGHNWPNFRRSSLSILSQKSLLSSGTSRCSVTSYPRRGHMSSISRVHSDACSATQNRFRSTDYINCTTKAQSTSPLSLQSCCAGQQHQTTKPRSLNYVTVTEHISHNNFTPLQVITTRDEDHDTPLDLATTTINRHRPPHGSTSRTWLTPQTSPIVDYCQIDLNGTYALRDVDRKLHNKNSPHSHSPHDDLLLHSFSSLDRMSEHLCSLSFTDKKSSASGRTKHSSKNSLRRLFLRKCGSTN